MGGGSIQLAAYGAQDVYLTTEPEITYFKVVYKRYTDFSMETFENVLTDNPNFGEKGTIKLERNGDLVHSMYLKIIISEVNLSNNKFAWVTKLGYAIINNISINIGGVTIDKHCGDWMNIWYELTRTGNHGRGHDILIGNVKELTEYNNKSKPQYELFIPINFWFCKKGNQGLSLPFVTIQYHDVYLNIEYSNIEQLVVTDCNFSNFEDIHIIQTSILTDYLYLDIAERKRFCKFDHDYLIEQLQQDIDNPIDREKLKLKLDFNRPIKELIWVAKDAKFTTNRQYMYYTHDKNEWKTIIDDFVINILNNSIVITEIQVIDDELCPVNNKYNNWIILDNYVNQFGIPEPSGLEDFMIVGTDFIVTTPIPSSFNNSIYSPPEDFRVLINPDSVIANGMNITKKIAATITVDTDGNMDIVVEYHDVTIRDISFEVHEYVFDLESPIYDEPICVNQFGNYGLYIDGSGTPCFKNKLSYNERCRFDKRKCDFFTILQPYMSHSNIPDSINLYSFSLEPEKYQPTGTSNISAINNVIFDVWFDDVLWYENDKNNMGNKMSPVDINSRFLIFATSYNILRINNGLAGLAHTP